MSGKPKDISNKKFGNLTALIYVRTAKNGSASWLCKCGCGNECVVRGDSLRSGAVISCGCLRGLNNNSPRKIKIFPPTRDSHCKSNNNKIDLNRRANCKFAMETCWIKYIDCDNLPCKGCRKFKQQDFTIDPYKKRLDYTERTRHVAY